MPTRKPLVKPARPRTLEDDIKLMRAAGRECAEDRGDKLAIAGYIRWMRDTAGAVSMPAGKVK